MKQKGNRYKAFSMRRNESRRKEFLRNRPQPKTQKEHENCLKMSYRIYRSLMTSDLSDESDEP